MKPRTQNTGNRLLPSTVQGTLLLLLLVALLPVTLLQAWIYYKQFRMRRAEEFATNLEVAHIAAIAVTAYLRDISHQELALGNDLLYAPPPQANHLLHVNQHAQPALLRYNWVDLHGQVLASSDPRTLGTKVGNSPYFQHVIHGKEWEVNNLFYSPADHCAEFTVARCIRRDGRPKGVIVTFIDPQRLTQALAMSRPAQGAVMIFDHTGRPVFRYPPAPMNWQLRNRLAQLPTLKKALAGQEATAFVTSPFTGRKLMVATVPIPGIGWAAGASRPEELAMAPLTRDLHRDFGVLVLVALLPLLMALLIGHTITGPLKRLHQQARNVELGELGSQVAPSGPAEVQLLTAAFNRMSSALSDHEAERDQLLAQVRQQADDHEVYVHMISHDLRSPLTIILGHAELLHQQLAELNIDDQMQMQIATIISSARHMNVMIQHLVETARLEAGQLALQARPVQLPVFLQTLLQRTQVAMDVSRIYLTIPADFPAVQADPDQLERILVNLLTNALKYAADTTPIQLTARVQGAEAVIAVSDQGAGITAEAQAHLFERFYQVRQTRCGGGLGLGLYITRMLVEAHGGRIWVESTPGLGSTFSFTLPLATTAQAR